MNQAPVLFFAFANEEERFLSSLKKESAVINQALMPIDAKGFVKVVREESLETEDMFRFFHAYKERMVLFHFAGHAGEQALNFEDQSAGIQELANLMAEQKDSLKLVFLNGCATADQVEHIHNMGIPVVIATQRAIDDKNAQVFASRFYSALANHYSLKGAFQHAKTYLKLKFGKDIDMFRSSTSVAELDYAPNGSTLRAMDFSRKEKKDSIPWGLYLAEDASEEMLDWKLPQFYAAPPPSSVSISYTVNKNILQLLKAVKEKAPHLTEQQYHSEEALIITSFPWTISVHLFRLFADAESMSVPGILRLKELIQAYISTTRFLSYIAMAQLWNEVKLGKLTVSDELEEFFLLQKDSEENFDYLLLLQKICDCMQSSNVDWFFPEVNTIAQLWAPGSPNFDQYRFVEALRWRLQEEEVPQQEIEEGCFVCESVLTELLSQAANLVNFSLLTVRDIRIINPGHISVATPFEHMIGDLHVPFQTYLKHRPRSLEDYINSHSVVLTERSGENRINKYLNLSPFYLDKTAFGESKGKNTPMIYALHHWDEESIVFKNVNFNVNQAAAQNTQSSIDILYIKKGMEEYQIIREQMDSFIKDIKA